MNIDLTLIFADSSLVSLGLEPREVSWAKTIKQLSLYVVLGKDKREFIGREFPEYLI